MDVKQHLNNNSNNINNCEAIIVWNPKLQTLVYDIIPLAIARLGHPKLSVYLFVVSFLSP